MKFVKKILQMANARRKMVATTDFIFSFLILDSSLEKMNAGKVKMAVIPLLSRSFCITYINAFILSSTN